MKRDLDRFGEKMTPAEERQVWSRMRDEIRGRERGEGRHPVAWLGRVALAAGMAVLAFAIWRAGEGPQGPGDWVPSPTRQPRVVKMDKPPGTASEGYLDEQKPPGTRAEEPGGPMKEKPDGTGDVTFEALEKAPGTEGEVSDELSHEGAQLASEAPEAVAEPSREAVPRIGASEVEEDRSIARGAPAVEKKRDETAEAADGRSMASIQEKPGETQEIEPTRVAAERPKMPPADSRITGEDLDAIEVKPGAIHVRGGRGKDAEVRVDGLPADDIMTTYGESESGKASAMRQQPPEASPPPSSTAAEINRRLRSLSYLASEAPPPEKHPSLTGGQTPVNDELADDMFFRDHGVNPFVLAEEDALSTFGLDVDTGSYTVARRYINEGALPPPEAIRVEEFINFFRKNYEPPKDGDFSIQIDGMPSPFAHVQDGSYWLFRVGIRGRVIEDEERMPVQLILVIDSSGSMEMQNRLDLVKRTMDVLLDELKPIDEVGVVTYNSNGRVVLPLTRVLEKETILNAIHSLHHGGSTNAEEGLKLAYEMARSSRREEWLQRIILCSDGVANVGRTGPKSILQEVRDESDRTPLTTVGFGMGNYNDVLMEQLADAGDGQYAYVDDLKEAVRVFRENITGTLYLIARNTKVQVEFDPERVIRYRLLGYENRDIRDEDFRDNKVDAGEIGSGHEVTALYEVKLVDGFGDGPLATVRLRYEKPEGGQFVEVEKTIRSGDLHESVDRAPGDLILDAAVAEFAEILRESYWAKESTPAAVLDLLQKLPTSIAEREDVRELREMVERASALGE